MFFLVIIIEYIKFYSILFQEKKSLSYRTKYIFGFYSIFIDKFKSRRLKMRNLIGNQIFRCTEFLVNNIFIDCMLLYLSKF